MFRRNYIQAIKTINNLPFSFINVLPTIKCILEQEIKWNRLHNEDIIGVLLDENGTVIRWYYDSVRMYQLEKYLKRINGFGVFQFLFKQYAEDRYKLKNVPVGFILTLCCKKEEN